jgi:hypothetical protein
MKLKIAPKKKKKKKKKGKTIKFWMLAFINSQVLKPKMLIDLKIEN